MHLYDWIVISKSENLSEEFIRENQNKLEWKYIIFHQKHLSEEFWWEFKFKIEEVDRIMTQGFSDDFVKEFRSDDGWCSFFNRYKVSERFIESIENKSVLTWESIFKNQRLSFDFIFKNRYEVNLNIIFMFQNSIFEDDLLKFFQDIDWNRVYKISNINTKDIDKFKKNLYNNISRNQNFTDNFLEENLYGVLMIDV